MKSHPAAEAGRRVGDRRRHELQRERLARRELLADHLERHGQRVRLPVELHRDRRDLVADHDVLRVVDELREDARRSVAGRRRARVGEREPRRAERERVGCAP